MIRSAYKTPQTEIGVRTDWNAHVSRTAWITGAGGLIGSNIVRAAPHDWHAIPLTRESLDLTESDAVRARFHADQPHLVIHCAAISKSPVCQAQPELAWKTNFEATRFLAELAANVPLIFFSTDLVFDGRQGGYSESDPPHPLTVYGETKVAAEHVVLENPRHTVIRSSINGGPSPTGDRGFTDELLATWRAGRAAKLFTDEFRSPLFAADTARIIWQLVAANRPGLYHIAGGERLSRFQIGELVAAHCPELNPRIDASSIRDYAGPPRSPDTSLDGTKIQRLLSLSLPRFSERLNQTSLTKTFP